MIYHHPVVLRPDMNDVMSLQFLLRLTDTCLVRGSRLYYAYLECIICMYSSFAKCQSILVICPGRLVVGQHRLGLI